MRDKVLSGENITDIGGSNDLMVEVFIKSLRLCLRVWRGGEGFGKKGANRRNRYDIKRGRLWGVYFSS